ncbi:hypothetical protein PL263_07835 [Methylomonas sp. EFPC3]|uniref:hypothetical protein n=1 Tax=Methylomonas sp. EFPC3 TaxID=3021710 RepID=UPI002417527C|nr:hypothetical protein [Methylomonas sp. EFPC3]WFP51932.1 hypothetical protein PL263_07835 [Methylomonas sp. EFPC3]
MANSWRWLILFIGLASALPAAWAEAYLPADAGQVIETLPARGSHWLELRTLRQQVAAAPQALPPVLQLVRRYIELGRAEADPRYFGYAEAALQPWLLRPAADPEVLTLQATLLQNRHDFAPALALLERALAVRPRLAQAWLTRAAILEVQGDYAAAAGSCLPLAKTAAALVGAVCINSVLSLAGQSETAYRQLQQALEHASGAAATDRQWALVTLAEIAERRGDVAAAERHYRQALSAAEADGYLLAAYADFLLDRQRYAEVVDLLADRSRADPFLLRLALAERHLPQRDSNAHTEALQARFAALRLRGDNRHQADEARFRLQLCNEAEAAFALAQANWMIQREPRDARILLEAALAAGKPRTELQPVLDFLAANGMQDSRLQPLIARFGEEGV